MGAKRLTLEERAARARQGDFDEDLTGIDASNVLGPVISRSTRNYWRWFVSERARRNEIPISEQINAPSQMYAPQCWPISPHLPLHPYHSPLNARPQD